jgi:AraC family transcriptional regulator
MTEQLDVRIVRLEPLHVASAHGFGEGPEGLAWDRILTWAGEAGLLESLDAHRFFGFNNPDPAPGSPNYGYEQWITVGPEVAGAEGITIKDFPGGLYAVARCQGIPRITDVWRQLVAWREASPYAPAYHQWLEECLTPALNLTPDGKPAGEAMPLDQIVMDLYMPIAG